MPVDQFVRKGGYSVSVKDARLVVEEAAAFKLHDKDLIQSVTSTQPGICLVISLFLL